MDLTYLHTFCLVARLRSFTKAAEELGYVQSSVTAQIQKLEREYGAALFERFGRGIRLTQAGEELLKYAREMLQLHEEAKAAVSAQASGRIVIGTIETLAAFFLPPLLQRFRRLYPGVQVVLQPGSEAEIIARVREGECDVGLMLDRAYTGGEFVCLQLREEELVLLAAPDHPLAGSAEPLKTQALGGHPMIVTEESCTYRSALERELRGEGVPYLFAYELGSVEAIKQCLVHGLGVGLLPAIAVREELASGKLAVLPYRLPGPPFYTQLIHHPKKWVSASLQSFIGLLSSR
ncbi:LysR family transcriptional regulator [Paenibacillus mucilaginosus]|uniref:LysR family transcriptional regulator n=3 Tax=Paenibacillus mucilaginosus TaxID=61624 RepID=H6N9A6_9BACL|nr:LysR family transcriptional regulator [Paenibacillus mucilaginosus]AEI39610.1 transcriptional regulator, LysR family [Paenibacillus mucilaginosus KNP414]AFC27852.1 LysR family transcriptional regulator [Paenibacillus mucilaginosus 3016]AFH60006.1 LysR family transcriptional regulator [Paenibacillus mucilaginosus K02]MCG7218018.1 LysR family transcriptional regulator [Paenibacillus mucilaginosus]WDM28554.1 LysR family transcriptional regulator [Paenibacillus mucilaginosus]